MIIGKSEKLGTKKLNVENIEIDLIKTLLNSLLKLTGKVKKSKLLSMHLLNA